MGGLNPQDERLMGEIVASIRNIEKAIDLINKKLDNFATKEQLSEIKQNQDKFITKGEFARYTTLIITFIGLIVGAVKSLFGK